MYLRTDNQVKVFLEHTIDFRSYEEEESVKVAVFENQLFGLI